MNPDATGLRDTKESSGLRAYLRIRVIFYWLQKARRRVYEIARRRSVFLQGFSEDDNWTKLKRRTRQPDVPIRRAEFDSGSAAPQSAFEPGCAQAATHGNVEIGVNAIVAGRMCADVGVR
jgi:hypothetical protein